MIQQEREAGEVDYEPRRLGDGGARYEGAHRYERGGQHGAAEERLASALGWFSLGLGLAGLAAPREVARLIGVPDDDRTRDVLRGIGLREVVQGVGILTQPRPAPWLWSRVAGDVMDLALLGRALGSDQAQRDRVTAAAAAVAGVTALDIYASQQMTRAGGADLEALPTRRVQHARSVTIRRPRAEVYAFWRALENLPRFMRHIESVQEVGGGRSRWRACGPAGMVVEWEAETVEERPNELIAWRALPGSEVYNCGRVEFRDAPGERGTEVHLSMEYAPPGGVIGAAVARVFGREPGQELSEDLRRFKQVMETGEVVVSDGSLHGATFPQRPARPPADQELAAAGLPHLETAAAEGGER
jgi:uncharacterized membrane protein